MITEYGRLTRESRLEIGETLLSMARYLDENVAYLSGTETGRIAINESLARRTYEFFRSKGLLLDKNLMQELANKNNSKFKPNALFKR
ncbi:hypothetical protein [Nitrosomonas sp. Is37]|uniref:hypothetical protein n=1 Tax=Nitrosomonas sp. Is37 TaxID=3080535 RepID=UPI00294B62A5|nr:hypothetical protein [Nitrosomonas sp. Is37]MDV6345235.1 hypothetical protein [Nitrosomonas sp. Is37]